MSESVASRTIGAHVHMRPLPGVDYSSDELGVVHDTTPADVLAALALPGRGTIYDLDAGRWPGMPHLAEVHAPFVLTSYRTPKGQRVQGDSINDGKVGFNSELLIASMHTGTHIDSLCHVTCGSEGAWYGGATEAEAGGDFGPIRAEASSIPPIVCRGVLLDVATANGVDALEALHLITADEVRATLARQEVEVRAGDAVLVRTGYMQVWDSGDPERIARHAGAGIGIEAARYLGDLGVSLVGSDTEACEQFPSPHDPDLLPVHLEFLIRRGIHIIEIANLEELARDRVYEFLFVCLPLRVRGATASMIRPIAVA